MTVDSFCPKICLSNEIAIKVLQAATVLNNYPSPANTNVEVIVAQLYPTTREYDPHLGALRNIHNN